LPASGDTPAGLYKKLVEQVNKSNLNISDGPLLALTNGPDDGHDEVAPVSFRQSSIQSFAGGADKICFFDGRAKDLQKECESVKFYSSAGRALIQLYLDSA